MADDTLPLATLHERRREVINRLHKLINTGKAHVSYNVGRAFFEAPGVLVDTVLDAIPSKKVLDTTEPKATAVTAVAINTQGLSEAQVLKGFVSSYTPEFRKLATQLAEINKAIVEAQTTQAETNVQNDLGFWKEDLAKIGKLPLDKRLKALQTHAKSVKSDEEALELIKIINATVTELGGAQ
jgi:chaperonin cofactor prefoldin